MASLLLRMISETLHTWGAPEPGLLTPGTMLCMPPLWDVFSSAFGKSKAYPAISLSHKSSGLQGPSRERSRILRTTSAPGQLLDWASSCWQSRRIINMSLKLVPFSAM